MSWTDKGNYWLHDAEQLTDEWFDARFGRPTASKYGACVGHSSFSTPEDIASRILSKDRLEMNDAMRHGVITEPYARKWYENSRGVMVKELGLAVPKWDVRIGASVDGDVYNLDGSPTPGMIEIKAPKRMYKPLINYMKYGDTGNFDHIWKSHYDQMQGCMAVLGKEWCDYVVYCTPENSVFVQRVPFDVSYWNDFLYPKLDKFIRNNITPKLVGTSYPIVP